MTDFSKQSCVACRADAPKAAEPLIQTFLADHPDWSLVERDGIERLERVFCFANFVDALAFTQKVGELAEAENHHPAILTEWGRVTVTWWTHKIKGLHNNDLIAAAKTDLLLN